jgi:DNA polymerase-3 subunit delta'
MLFKEIIGQNEIKNQMILSIQEGRIPHAMLFEGPSGIGKLQLAIAYAQYLACPHRTSTDACGKCPTCLQYAKLQHPDLHFAFPIVKQDSKDTCNDFYDSFRNIILKKKYFDLDDWYKEIDCEKKQGMIYEKESSEILRKLTLKSFGNGYKVMIIWQADKMNLTCANKLLKLLEDPPEKTIFILVSNSPDLLIPTILSRVQRFHIRKLTQQDIQTALQEYFTQKNLTTETIEDYAHIANGNYIEANRLAQEHEENDLYFKFFVQLMRSAWLVGNKKDYAALQQIKQWSQDIADTNNFGREKQKAFLKYAQKQVRENYIFNFNEKQMLYQTQAERDFSRRFSPYVSDQNIDKLIYEFDSAEQQITQNGNAKIVFFDLCLHIILLMK